MQSATATTTTRTFFVDLQGFLDFEKNFILKELCILECRDNRFCANNEQIHHYIFKPPYAWAQLTKRVREQALWLKCFHHGFSWNSGDSEYSEIDSIFNKILMREETFKPIVVVKGAEKVKWFKRLTNDIFECVDMNNLGCNINLSDLEFKKKLSTKHCNRHDSSLHCAQQNVDILHNWLHEKY